MSDLEQVKSDIETFANNIKQMIIPISEYDQNTKGLFTSEEMEKAEVCMLIQSSEKLLN